MSRRIAAAVVFFVVAAAGVQAQQPQPRVFSKASIQKAIVIKPETKTASAKAPAPVPPAPRSMKSFFKTPWPYLIIGGVAAGVIIAVNSGNNNGTGSGIY